MQQARNAIGKTCSVWGKIPMVRECTPGKALVHKQKVMAELAAELLHLLRPRADQIMKCVPKCLVLAAGIMVLVSAAAPLTRAQQADQDQAPTAPRKSDAAAVPAQHANEPQMPASGEATTQEAQSFSGTIVKENGAVTLKDPVTKVSYKLNDATKARQYMGKRVKVTGKLDMNSNTILIDRIEPLS
jgi:hypothetical protein